MRKDKARRIVRSIQIDGDSRKLWGDVTLALGEGISCGLVADPAAPDSKISIGINPNLGPLAHDTDDLPEGSNNLYYTVARFLADFAAKTTSNLAEGSNLYYTNARARAALSQGAGIAYDAGTGVIAWSPGNKIKVGNIALTVLDASVPVAFSSPMSSSNYIVLFQRSALTPVVLAPSAQTPTGFTLLIAPSINETIKYIAIEP